MNNFFTEHRNKILLAAIIGLFMVLLGRIAMHFIYKPSAAKVVPAVKTIIAGAADLRTTASYPGEIKGRYESTLSFQVPGKIIKRNVNVGDKVTSGQILFALDPADIQQKMEAALAAQSSAVANYRLAQENAERFGKLYQGGAVSKASLDQYNTQLEAAAAALRKADAQVNTAANQLNYTVLRSDKPGVVTAIYGEVGQLAATGSPMAVVVESDEKEIHISIPEAALSHISLGQNATVNFWALPDTTVKARVREIAPLADPVTKTYKVKATLLDPPADVLLGMTAKAVPEKNETSADINMLTLPITAVYRLNDKPYVWIVKDNHVETVAVTIESYRENNVIISSGISKGDTVVTAGVNKLLPGQEVRILESGE